MTTTAPPLPSLFSHVWRSYFKTALVPVLLVEVVLVAAYLFTHTLVRDANIASIRAVAEHELSHIAAREARLVNAGLETLAHSTDLFRRRTLAAYQTPHDPGPEEQSRYATSPGGAWYTARDNGAAAAFYSAISPVDEARRQKAWQLAQLDGLMRDLVQTEPLMVQVYVNTHDSFNRIYPWFDTLSQYPETLDIPAYNFYYLADATHNPARDVVWTGVYVDPAGQGWMTSAIAPVYLPSPDSEGEYLEAVVGIDITVERLIGHLLDLDIPWDGYALLLDSEGTIMAMPEAAESDWGLDELTDHDYAEAITRDTFKPDDFNLFKRPELTALAAAMQAGEQGPMPVALADARRLATWARIPETDWTLLVMAPEETIYAEANSLAARFQRIGLGMIIALGLFYAVFFVLLFRRARDMSRSISQPLERMAGMAAQIGAGDYRPAAPRLAVQELQATADQLVDMGHQLDTSSRALREQTGFLQALMDTIPLPLFYTDAEQRFLGCNAPFAQLFGRSAEALTQTPLATLIPPLGADAPAEQELTVADASGQPREFLLQLARPDPAQTRGVGSIGVLLDISKRKQIEQAVANARDQAEEASRLKSQFLASMSHELRTPLNAILGFAQLLETDDSAPLSAEQQDSVAEISQAGEHLLRMISEVLDLAQIESGRMIPVLEPVACGPLLDECLQMIDPDAAQRGLQITALPAACQAQRVIADRARLRQALTHLLTNAVKYNRPEGRIDINCLATATGRIRLEIRDTGQGLTEAELAQAFEPFRRIDKSTVEGTGIGLTLTRRLVELMQGELGASSRPGSGSIFWVELPAAPDGPSTDPGP